MRKQTVKKFKVGVLSSLITQKIEYTTPRQASFAEFLLLELFKRKPSDDLLSVVLVEEFDIPEKMLSIFESALQKLIKENLVSGISSIEERLSSVNLTEYGQNVYVDKKIPSEWANESIEIVFNPLLNVYSKSNKKTMDDTHVIEGDYIYDKDSMKEYITTNKNQLSKKFKNDTELRLDKLLESPHWSLNGRHKIYEDVSITFDGEFKLEGRAEVLSKLKGLKYREYPSMASDYHIDRNMRFSIYKGKFDNAKVVFSQNSPLVEEDIPVLFGSDDSHYMVGVTKDGRGFTYDVEVFDINGYIVPIEQTLINDQEYIKSISTELEEHMKEVKDSELTEELLVLITSLLPNQLKPKYLLIILEQADNNPKNLELVRSFSKEMKIGSDKLTKAIQNRAEMYIDNLVESKENLDVIYDLYVKYQISFEEKYELIRDYFSTKEIYEALISKMNQQKLLNLMNIKNQLNKEFTSCIKNGLKLESEYAGLEVVRSMMMLTEEVLSIKNDFDYDEQVKYFRTPTTVSSEFLSKLKIKTSEVRKHFSKLGNLHNDVKYFVEKIIDDASSFHTDMLELLDVDFKVEDEISWEAIKNTLNAKKLKEDKLKVVAYKLRTLVESETNREKQGREKFVDKFSDKEVIKECHNAWRNLNKCLHGEGNLKEYKKTIPAAYTVLSKYFGGKNE